MPGGARRDRLPPILHAEAEWGRIMHNSPRRRFLPLILFPAVMPAILLPVLANHHLPDALLGLGTGISLGLALVGLVWIRQGKRRCSPE